MEQENQINNLDPKASPPPSKNWQKLVVIAVVVMAAATIIALKFGTNDQKQTKTTHNSVPNKKASSQKEVEQTLVNPVDGSKTALVATDYYGLKVGQSEYFGSVKKINNDYVRISPTAYQKGSVLVLTGAEIHGPEPIMYINIAKMTGIKKLDPRSQNDAAIIKLIKSNPTPGLDAYPSDDINSYLKPGLFKAFFFSDGLIFFARANTLDGKFLASSEPVYYTQAMEGSPTDNNPQLSLTLAQPVHYGSRTGAELLYWQNMRNDSKVSKAAIDFEKSR